MEATGRGNGVKRGLCLCKIRKVIACLCANRMLQERKGNTDSTEEEGELLRDVLESQMMGLAGQEPGQFV